MTLRKERILSFEGGSSRSHYVEESFWRRLWTCRQTEYWMKPKSRTMRCQNLQRTILHSGLLCGHSIDTPSSNQDILHPSIHPVGYIDHCFKNPILIPILCHINPLHALLSYSYKIHLTTVVPSVPWLWRQACQPVVQTYGEPHACTTVFLQQYSFHSKLFFLQKFQRRS